MKEKDVKSVDPAEVCECNPEWSNAPGSEEGDECRCSIVKPTETSKETNNAKDKK